MVQRGLLGNKTKAGFYTKQKGEGDKREIWTLDTATIDYRPARSARLIASQSHVSTSARSSSLRWSSGGMMATG